MTKSPVGPGFFTRPTKSSFKVDQILVPNVTTVGDACAGQRNDAYLLTNIKDIAQSRSGCVVAAHSVNSTGRRR